LARLDTLWDVESEEALTEPSEIHQCSGNCGGVFWCQGCDLVVGWCRGCNDELFELCDDCAVKVWAMREREAVAPAVETT